VEKRFELVADYVCRILQEMKSREAGALVKLDFGNSGVMKLGRLLMEMTCPPRTIGNKPLDAPAYLRRKTGRNCLGKMLLERCKMLVPSLTSMRDNPPHRSRYFCPGRKLGERVTKNLGGARITQLLEQKRALQKR
jgi:hypothetical protein